MPRDWAMWSGHIWFGRLLSENRRKLGDAIMVRGTQEVIGSGTVMFIPNTFL